MFLRWRTTKEMRLIVVCLMSLLFINLVFASSDDRPLSAKKYLAEFCAIDESSIIYKAILQVLLKMPYKDYAYITNRNRPVIFVDYSVDGTSRFASSTEFLVGPNDPPCCQEGFTLIKLGQGLGIAKATQAIEGVVAHEIAHRILEHIKNGNVDCNAERAANQLIQQWGFTTEFAEAKKLFGTRKGDPAGCQEKPATSK